MRKFVLLIVLALSGCYSTPSYHHGSDHRQQLRHIEEQMWMDRADRRFQAEMQWMRDYFQERSRRMDYRY